MNTDKTEATNEEKFVLGVLVANQYGVLMRVSSLFARRGFNIDSLTVGETENHEYSRITITATGDAAVREQIIKQLAKLHDVVKIDTMPPESTVIRELMLIKLRATSVTRSEIIDAVNVFRCKVVDFTPDELAELIAADGEEDLPVSFKEKYFSKYDDVKVNNSKKLSRLDW